MAVPGLGFVAFKATSHAPLLLTNWTLKPDDSSNAEVEGMLKELLADQLTESLGFRELMMRANMPLWNMTLSDTSLDIVSVCIALCSRGAAQAFGHSVKEIRKMNVPPSRGQPFDLLSSISRPQPGLVGELLQLVQLLQFHEALWSLLDIPHAGDTPRMISETWDRLVSSWVEHQLRTGTYNPARGPDRDAKELQAYISMASQIAEAVKVGGLGIIPFLTFAPSARN